ncbi:MAG: 2-C-methyl-D-erythritol 4-phosphate cytidylyltransferase [Candidatus Omnitrophica bacterium]|nr:2-C-methyl-D-erythritol 4-phosphate cytidylyltransferase [Candidatus Omnitrophota bacterium]
MKVQVIVVAAGVGTRLKASKPKALVLLNGKPLVWYSLSVFERCKDITSVIVVGHRDYLKDFQKIIQKAGFKKVHAVTPGGETRADSVACGLRCVEKDTQVVMVHDAARPFVSSPMISDSLKAMQRHEAAIIAVPVKATIKKADPKNLFVTETLMRDTLWEVQTPQTFRRNLLDRAHKDKDKLCCAPTDDAMLVEKMGVKVKIVMGDYKNIKITTAEDIALAKLWLTK